ncbi:TetR-like C-terminal domain-containing protein [Actinomadura miaoliensis]|uniref:Tetracyclin repressor-like C-terminal domain-containing protein n=1 Tax=Actinomadura miaoliensis TaxID=430685 RepID=A0ABP7UXA0_9ACTN
MAALIAASFRSEKADHAQRHAIRRTAARRQAVRSRGRRAAAVLVSAALAAAACGTADARRLWEDRYARCEIIVDRAVRRGELPPHNDARRLLIAATAPLYHQLVLLRTPPDLDLPDQAARTAALAASTGAFAQPPPVSDT